MLSPRAPILFLELLRFVQNFEKYIVISNNILYQTIKRINNKMLNKKCSMTSELLNLRSRLRK